MVCLPDVPDYKNDWIEIGEQARATIYSAEYHTSKFPPLSHLHDEEIPCAVCRVARRGTQLMIPAITSCPSGWSSEYVGYLMTANFAHQSSKDYVCVYQNAVAHEQTSDGNEEGALLSPVEGRCSHGNLPCRPYVNGDELACVVCTM